MASRAMLIACLVMVTMCVAVLSSLADDEARPSGAVTGVVAASGGATTTELKLYRNRTQEPRFRLVCSKARGKGRGWEIKSQAYTGRDGVARLIGLDPEKRYRLGVYPDSDLRLDLDREHVHDWEPVGTTVQLEKK